MTIEAMKQALEALEMLARYENPETKIQVRKPKDGGPIVTMYPHKVATDAANALRTAIAEAEKQEAWKTSDTAYRPEGLPQDFTKHEVDSFDDWSEWVCPDPTQYFMKCCDCGLVHEMQFNIVKYSAGDKCENVDDPHVQAVFRARRATPPAAQRQPLTDDQIDDIWNCYCDEMGEASINDAYDIARAIEAAHGITGEKK